MKKQLIILLLATLLITPLSLAQPTPTQPPTKTSVDAPVWTVGNNWTYRINDLTFNFNQDNQTIYIHAIVADLTIQVTSETTDSYQVTIEPTQITGDYAVNMDLGDGPINVTGEFKDTTISGTFTINKATLGFTDIKITVTGKMTILVHQQPYFPSFPKKLTFKTVLITSMDFAQPYAIIAFPLDIGNNWGIPANSVTLSGTMDSPWFKTINFFNQIVRGLHLYGLIANIIGTDEASVQQISDILDDVFPTVDIAHVMNEYLGSNTINTTEIPPVLLCNNTETVTVGAGTFNAYNITTPLVGSYILYAPDAGYIIKMVGQFNGTLPYINGVNLELVNTNYHP